MNFTIPVKHTNDVVQLMNKSGLFEWARPKGGWKGISAAMEDLGYEGKRDDKGNFVVEPISIPMNFSSADEELFKLLAPYCPKLEII